MLILSGASWPADNVGRANQMLMLLLLLSPT